ncbi:MAG: HugZ family protein [Geminicoccaceae bacterium]
MTADDQLSPATTGRFLLRSVQLGALATIMRDSGGAPYASLVSVATDHDGSPILLISDLADHTKNLRNDDRVSLLLNGSEGLTDPLAGARLTLQGKLARHDDQEGRRRYLARHAKASFYADFADFGFYRLDIEKAHLVAGFGRIHWLMRDDLLITTPDALVACDAEVVAHMNDDHGDAVQLYANKLLGRDGDGWLMTGIDAEGADLRNNGQVTRLTFGNKVNNSTDVRNELIRLVNKSRET